MRQFIAIALAFVCLFTSSPVFGQVPVDDAVRLKQQLNTMPANAEVEVRLQKKGSRKIEGRLVAVGDQEFEVRIDRTVSNQKIAFSDVKSIKEQKGSRLWVRIVVIGAVAWAAVGIIAYATLRGGV